MRWDWLVSQKSDSISHDTNDLVPGSRVREFQAVADVGINIMTSLPYPLSDHNERDSDTSQKHGLRIRNAVGDMDAIKTLLEADDTSFLDI